VLAAAARRELGAASTRFLVPTELNLVFQVIFPPPACRSGSSLSNFIVLIVCYPLQDVGAQCFGS
jgi:hypothetical protein